MQRYLHRKLFAAGPRNRSKWHFKPILEALENRLAPSVITSFTGLTAITSAWTTNLGNPEPFQPPDSDLAVSAKRVVQVANTGYIVFNKDGTNAVGSSSLETLFNITNRALIVGDPFVIFDENAASGTSSGRFVMGMFEIDLTNHVSYYDLAVSNDDTAAVGTWVVHTHINVSEATNPNGPFFADFPKIGFNADEIVLTFNQFPFNNQNVIDHILAVAIEAAPLFNNSTVTTHFYDVVPPNGNGTIVGGDVTLFPAQMHGTVAVQGQINPMFFVETGPNTTSQNGANTLLIYAGTNLINSQTGQIGTPTSITVPAYWEPSAVDGIAFDSRMLSDDWRNGELVAADTIGLSQTDAVAHARWYEVNVPLNGSITLNQDGNINIVNVHTFYPSVAVNSANGIGMTFMEIGTSQTNPNPLLSMAVTDRLATDTAGTMRPGLVTQAGAVAFGSWDTRFGDYSATATDPSDGHTFWSANEYATNNGTYRDDNGNVQHYPSWGVAISHFSAYKPQDIAGLQASEIWVSQSRGINFNTTKWAANIGNPGDTLKYLMSGDFNGDGNDDVAIWDATTGKWWVGISNGSSGFSFSTWGTWSTGVQWITYVGDFNGDGKMDLVGLDTTDGTVAGWSDKKLWVAISNGSSFTTSNWTPTPFQSGTFKNFVVGDFDGDTNHKTDVGLLLDTGSIDQWWVGISSGSSFTESASPWTTWSDQVSWQVYVGDVDGDGTADLVGRALALGTRNWADYKWWVSTSTGSSFNAAGNWAQWSPTGGWFDNSLQLGDFNGDGQSDIIGRDSSGKWWVYFSNGSSFFPAGPTSWATWSTGVTWDSVWVGDFNGDGFADIAGRDGVPNNGDGKWWVGVNQDSFGNNPSFSTSSWASWSLAVTWVSSIGSYGHGGAGAAGAFQAPQRGAFLSAGSINLLGALNTPLTSPFDFFSQERLNASNASSSFWELPGAPAFAEVSWQTISSAKADSSFEKSQSSAILTARSRVLQDEWNPKTLIDQFDEEGFDL
jgi:hypothetical protein